MTCFRGFCWINVSVYLLHDASAGWLALSAYAFAASRVGYNLNSCARPEKSAAGGLIPLKQVRQYCIATGCVPSVEGPLIPFDMLDGSCAFNFGSGVRAPVEYIHAMPRIPDQNLWGVVFLFRTVDEAKSRARYGGSGFIVGRYIEGSAGLVGSRLYVPYVISNRHVVYGAGAPVVSVNRRDGAPPDNFDFLQTDWVVHPDGDDLAAICVHGSLDKAVHELVHIREDNFVTKETINQIDIGLGDEVYMIGRFINHQGETENKPAARFGNISMMPQPLWNTAIRKNQESYAVEMRSRTGFSGAPVTVYRTIATVLADVPPGSESYYGLLGVNWGHVIDEDGENTWLNGVVPAWKITELLDVPKLKAKQDEITVTLRRLVEDQGGAEPASASSEPPTTDGGSQHKERFSSLLNAAVKSPKPAEET